MSASTKRTSLLQESNNSIDTETIITADIASIQRLRPADAQKRERPSQTVRFRSQDDVRVFKQREHVVPGLSGKSATGDTNLQAETPTKATTRSATFASTHSESPLPAGYRTMMFRCGALACILAAVVPLLQNNSVLGHASIIQPVSGSTIPKHDDVVMRRDDSPTSVCFRWAQQSATVNGTLYLYGGQATTEPGQTENAWNNNFLSLDLTKTWQISTPALTGRPRPSGPPAVSLGYLWNSHESLFLYGGQVSWKPVELPPPFSTWEYNIANDEWIEHGDPVTSGGESAPSDGEPVQRAAEGAGVNVASLGRGFYFGGHLDGYTVQGWSQSVPRVYLQSLLEFTFPGAENNQVQSLSGDRAAGSDGVYRNITEGGLQAEAGFTKRADGLLVYVPGFGDQGILLALAGGTNETFTQMNNINVYDIATSQWYVQSTSGPTPNIRVNPCAVTAAAPDGSSLNIYMFGGQNLIPAGNQTQYDDMWILSLPSFTWIEVDTSGQSVPYGRSGHTCSIRDGQMVVVGGYVGDQSLTCESPGIYVFDLSALEWVNQFTARSAGADESSDSSNPFNQQLAQRFTADSPGGLEGSYGYTVPQAVIDVVGGNENGGATITAPINTATAGPLATGKPITYTNADGSTATSTPESGGSNSGGGGDGVNVGAIVAGCVAGVLFIIACYLAFCAYVYRKQLQLYKRHVEMSQAQARGEKVPTIPGLLGTGAASFHGKSTPSDTSYARGGSSMASRWNNSDSPTAGGSHHSRNESGGSSNGGVFAGGYNAVRRNSDVSVEEDLLSGREPTFVGVLMSPRRSLRVINRD